MDTYTLLRQAAEGNQKAMEQLVEENMGLVYMVASRFRERNAEQEDIIQIASLGLLKAIRNFSPEFNVKFSTYAVPVMMGEVKRFFRDDGPIKVSRSYKAIAAKATAIRENLLNRTNREPTLREIAEIMNRSTEEIADALSSVTHLESIDAPTFDNSLSLTDILTDNRDKTDACDRIALKELIKKLPERERKILMLRYIKEETQAKTASRFGLSQVQISRIEKKILEKLKREMIL